ncbi:MAG: hypothetical protein MUE77_10060 [Sandarakinorhabdus sp.]|nr:hypothetical protein [Sandarakinorhabdus sp.]
MGGGGCASTARPSTPRHLQIGFQGALVAAFGHQLLVIALRLHGFGQLHRVERFGRQDFHLAILQKALHVHHAAGHRILAGVGQQIGDARRQAHQAGQRRRGGRRLLRESRRSQRGGHQQQREMLHHLCPH